MDLERAQILSYTMQFNVMNEESGQINYLLMPTVLSNFVVNSTTVAYTYLNSSWNIFYFKEKRFTKFPFNNQTPYKVLPFKCLIVVSNQIFALNSKAPRRFNSNIIPVNLKLICLQVCDRYSYISLDPEVLWVISELKRKQKQKQKTILSSSWIFLRLFFIEEKSCVSVISRVYFFEITGSVNG